MDKARFFASIRRDLFPKGLQPQQVERAEMLLDACVAAAWPLPWTAYALATAHHETAQWLHMKELGGSAYFTRMYDISGARPAKAKELGNVEVGDGAKFAGRGYVQLTGRTNYAKAGKALGLDLIANPELVETPEIAARVLRWGMATGAYTGKKNADYLDASPPDYAGARRIINGTDKASLIAGYAKSFATALASAGYGVPEPANTPDAVPVEALPTAPAEPPMLPVPERPAPKSILERLARIFGG